MSADKALLRDHFENNIYGIWRQGEKVTFELLGPDTRDKSEIRNPFEVVGGEIVRILVSAGGRDAEFKVHVYLPDAEACKIHPKGCPFIVCMHPLLSAGTALSKGYALIVMENGSIASDDTEHKGAFYDLYPYGEGAGEQTGVLMAWAWGASRVLDAVLNGLDEEFSLDADASLVTGVSRWGKATAVCGAFDDRFKMVIPACSGAGGLALFSVFSEGKTYDLSLAGGPSDYTYGKNEPLDCLQSDAERGWFNDRFLQYKKPSDIPIDQDGLVVLAMNRDRYYFVIAAYTNEDWVNAPAMWECYKKAAVVYEGEGLSDNLVIHFHKEGHAVIDEDMELITGYFDHMYYGMDTGVRPGDLKSTVFNGQE